MIPENLEQCYQALKELLPLQDRQEFIKTPIKSLSRFHHTLGQWIRNNWQLWGAEKNPLRDCIEAEGIVHPDDMSGHILRYCWNRFHEDEAKVDKEQVRIETKPW